jgi:hypothetical protein
MTSDYADEKTKSEALDAELGFRIAGTESKIADRLANAGNPSRQETWNHLSPQVFQTPYAELERIVNAADPEGTIRDWADLGAAYGRLGIVLARLRPHARFIGSEVVPERVYEGRRVYASLGLDPESLVCTDLTLTAPPVAEIYFIYDFGNREAIDAILEILRERARRDTVRIVGRGRGIRDAIERRHPWLSVIPPFHSAHFSVYRSR